MASFVIMEAPHGKAGAPEERIEVIRDGFSFWAFVFPFFWLLWHRLWIEAVLVLAAGAVTGMVGSWPAFEFMSSALAVLISLFVGLEANNLRIAALRRRGWSESAVIEAGSRAEAELRFFAGLNVDEAAQALGVSRKTLSSILNGRAGISPEMALRLSKAFNTSPESWLNQQVQYDLWHAKKTSKGIKVKKLYAA